ncbi:hypothetical protein [Ruegeria profundi]|uniref:hypothetical protein n=1 Tax=Ruegeria profundi TaxID=1685378 RepID=UPI003C7E69E5
MTARRGLGALIRLLSPVAVIEDKLINPTEHLVRLGLTRLRGRWRSFGFHLSALDLGPQEEQPTSRAVEMFGNFYPHHL